MREKGEEGGKRRESIETERCPIVKSNQCM